MVKRPARRRGDHPGIAVLNTDTEDDGLVFIHTVRLQQGLGKVHPRILHGPDISARREKIGAKPSRSRF